jgi:hypothetical protein
MCVALQFFYRMYAKMLSHTVSYVKTVIRYAIYDHAMHFILSSHAVVPPVEQWQNSYIVYAWTDDSPAFISYINLNYIGDNPNGVLIDGATLSNLGVQWENLSLPGLPGVTVYSARLQVSTSATHVVKHVNPEETLGLITYGIADFDSYSKPAGMAVADLLANPRCPVSDLADTVEGINSTNIIGYSNCSSASYAEGSTCTATCSPGTVGGLATCTSSPQGGVWVASDCKTGTAKKRSYIQ